MEAPICCICLDGETQSNPLERLMCDHRFHSDCMMDWLESDNSKMLFKCPNCNRIMGFMKFKTMIKTEHPVLKKEKREFYFYLFFMTLLALILSISGNMMCVFISLDIKSIYYAMDEEICLVNRFFG